MRGRGVIGAVIAVLGALLLAGTGEALAAGDPIMPLAQVHSGMDCTARTVVRGTTISTFNVHVIDVVRDPSQGARILVSVSGPVVDGTGIAEGFSGSPVYCSDGVTDRVIGAISAGVGQYGNNVGLVTPIEQMLGEPVKPPAGAPRLQARSRPLDGPLTFGGLAPSLMRLVQRAARRAGRVALAAPGAPAADFPVQPLIPGASVAAAYASGAIPIGAIGTVTYRDGRTVYAFGHELDGAGRRSLLLQDAYVYYVVGNPNVGADTSYKLARPGHTEGALTSDTPNAIVGQVGSPPPLVPVRVTAHDLDTGKQLALVSQVADETDVDNPLGSGLTTLVAPIEVAQAAAQIYNGPPANESGRMCVRVLLRETPAPLSFCNRYVGTGSPGDLIAPPYLAMLAGTDISSALSLIDAVSFRPLHVRRVDAQVYAARGLHEATIDSASAPRRVRPGQRVTVRMKIRLYRGPLREVSFRVRIPRRAHGRLVATIANAQQLSGGGSGQSLGQALSQLLGGGSLSSGPGGPPNNMTELRHQFAATGVYDGLAVQFKHARPRDVYRDPHYVITGSARLVFHLPAAPKRKPRRRHHKP